MAPLLRDQLSSAEDRAATLIRNLPSLSRNHNNPMARKILREGLNLGRGHALSLHVPLLVATAGYLIAIGLAWTTLRDR
jgi:hypothetical protein